MLPSGFEVAIFGPQSLNMKSLLSICVILLTVATVGCKAQTTTPKYDLPVAEFDKLSKETTNAVLVDLRSPVDYVEAYVPNAVNIDYNGKYWNQVIGTLDKTKPYFMYCYAGVSSLEAADTLRAQGFTQIYTLKGGFAAWQKADMPTARHDVNLRSKQ